MRPSQKTCLKLHIIFFGREKDMSRMAALSRAKR